MLKRTLAALIVALTAFCGGTAQAEPLKLTFSTGSVGGGFFAVGGQIHHRVHRVDRACLAHFLLLSPAAGGKGQRERRGQNSCQHTFCHSFLRNNEAFVSVPAARVPVSRR